MYHSIHFEAHFFIFTWLRGSTFSWFSYFTDFFPSQALADSFSSLQTFNLGIYQVSIVGPLLFSLYTVFIGNLICFEVYLYNDISQIYFLWTSPLNSSISAQYHQLVVSNWHLRFSEFKTGPDLPYSP